MIVVRIDLATVEEGNSSFEYENIPIPCKACGIETNYHEIEYDPIGLKGELEVTRCPQCGTHNSFEFELEEFDERYIIDGEIEYNKIIDTLDILTKDWTEVPNE